MATGAQEAQDLLRQASPLDEARRRRLLRDLAAASDAYRPITQPSQRLTQGTPLTPSNIVTASDPTLAPIIKGKSHGPAQCGRTIGRLSESASGFIFANRVPQGHPSDPSSVLPLLDTVHQALDLVVPPKRCQGHSLGGALGVNDAE